MGGTVGLPVSLSVPPQASGRLEALVFSQGLLHWPLKRLGPHCPCGAWQSLAVEVEVEVEVAAALSLQHQTLGGVSLWPCRSGRVLAAWCWAARPPQALR